jgi:hypothetical protein
MNVSILYGYVKLHCEWCRGESYLGMQNSVPTNHKILNCCYLCWLKEDFSLQCFVFLIVIV